LLAPRHALAQQPGSAIQDATARTEIERVLTADNLDTARLSPRDVADAIARIERGRAPEDFWSAYQLHVRAWSRLADAFERAQRQQGESTFVEGMEEVETAADAIESTFDEVERIARRYGARLPTPPINTETIA
jgi:hypothetical protein